MFLYSLFKKFIKIVNFYFLAVAIRKLEEGIEQHIAAETIPQLQLCRLQQIVIVLFVHINIFRTECVERNESIDVHLINELGNRYRYPLEIAGTTFL